MTTLGSMRISARDAQCRSAFATGFVATRYDKVFNGDKTAWVQITISWLLLMVWVSVFFVVIRVWKWEAMTNVAELDHSESTITIFGYSAFVMLLVSLLTETDSAAVGGSICYAFTDSRSFTYHAVNSVMVYGASLAMIFIFTFFSNKANSGDIPLGAALAMIAAVCLFIVWAAVYAYRDGQAIEILAFALTLTGFVVCITLADIVICASYSTDHTCVISQSVTGFDGSNIWVHHYQIGLIAMTFSFYGNGAANDVLISTWHRKAFTLYCYAVKAAGFALFCHGIMNYGPDSLADSVDGYKTTTVLILIGLLLLIIQAQLWIRVRVLLKERTSSGCKTKSHIESESHIFVC